ncbi:MAG: hypothetical protein CVT72_13405, partial [Alphaproteobacteria bacterium HGW-Alphaproteobacteria-11]
MTAKRSKVAPRVATGGGALVPLPVGLSEKEAAQEAYRRLDRRVHARLGAAVGGVSVIGLAQAWGDWASHLALSPGKQMELVWKASRKWQRLAGALGRDPDSE